MTSERTKKPPPTRITVYIDPQLYIRFGQKVLGEKGKFALSEKIVELIEQYLTK